MEPSVPPKRSAVPAPAPLTVRDFLRAEVQKSIEARLRECQRHPIVVIPLLTEAPGEVSENAHTSSDDVETMTGSASAGHPGAAEGPSSSLPPAKKDSAHIEPHGSASMATPTQVPTVNLGYRLRGLRPGSKKAHRRFLFEPYSRRCLDDVGQPASVPAAREEDDDSITEFEPVTTSGTLASYNSFSSTSHASVDEVTCLSEPDEIESSSEGATEGGSESEISEWSY